MTKIILTPGSPLALRNETQGTYFDRIGEMADKILEFKQDDERSIRELAHIIAKLPSDYDWCHRSRLFSRTKECLRTLEKQKKLFFKETFLSEGGHISHLNFYLPDHEMLIEESEIIKKGVFPFSTLNPNTPVKLYK